MPRDSTASLGADASTVTEDEVDDIFINPLSKKKPVVAAPEVETPAFAIGLPGDSEVETPAFAIGLGDSDEDEEDDDQDGNSLGLFSRSNPVRKLCEKVASSVAFEIIIMFFVVVNVVGLAIESPGNKLTDEHKQWFELFDFGAGVVFTVEAAIRIVAAGFVTGPAAYLQSGWNCIDFAVMLCFWIAHLYQLITDTKSKIKASSLRVVRLTRPLLKMPMFVHLQTLFRALSLATPLFGLVSTLLVFLFMLFGTMGVQLFEGVLTNMCVEPTDQHGMGNTLAECTAHRGTANTYAYQHWNCSTFAVQTEYHCPKSMQCSAQSQCLNIPISDGSTTEGSWRADENRFIGFNSLVESSLTIFVMTTLDEWPAISFALTDAKFAENFLAWPFCATIVVTMALLAAELFTAVVAHAYEVEAHDPDHHIEARSPRQNFSAYSPRATPRSTPRASPRASQRVSMSTSITETFEVDDDRSGDVGTTEVLDEAHHRVPFVPVISPMCSKLLATYAFEATIMFTICVNAIFLGFEHFDPTASADTHHMKSGWHDVIFWGDVVFTIIYSVELCIKWLGMGFREFFCGEQRIFNIVDVVVVACGIIGFFIEQFQGATSLRLLRLIFRTVRLMRVFQIMSKNSNMLAMFESVFKSVHAIANLVVFIALVMVAASILGIHSLGFSCQDAPMRVNYASFSNGLLTSFQVMSGEDWGLIMYQHMHCHGWSAALFFIVLFVWTNWILLSVFVAVVLQNFHLDEAQKKLLQEDEFLLQYATDNDRSVAKYKFLTSFNPARRVLISIATSSAFEQGIVFCIIMSSVSLALERPPMLVAREAGAGSNELQLLLHGADFVFLALFWFESIVKISAFGLHTYWSDAWNRFDLMVTVGSTVDLMFLLAGFNGVGARTFRVLRVLRPLRLIRHNPGIRVVINTILKCLPMICSVLCMVFFVFYIFAVIGVFFFSGKFWRCTPLDGASADVALNTTQLSRLDCPPSQWRNPGFSFDNIGAALETLFVCATTEGWVDVMHSAMDMTDVGLAPSLNMTYASSIYFVTFILVGSFFMSGLFVGILVCCFNECSGHALLTNEQIKWVQVKLLAINIEPDLESEPQASWRRPVFKIVINRGFDALVSVCIFLNVVIMMVERYPQSESRGATFEVLHSIFAVVFFLEVVLKVIGFGPRAYWSNAWNRFDFFVVLSSGIQFVVQDFAMLQAVRALRALRILLLVKRAQSLKTIISTLILSVPPTLNIMAIMALLIFMYGVVGMQMFGGVPYNTRIHQYDNFDNIFNAMRLLFQVMTGQDFLGIVNELRDPPNNCTFAFGYFGSFYALAVYIGLNIFIAALLQNFELSFDTEALDITPGDLLVFKHAWDQTAGAQPDHMPRSRICLGSVEPMMKSLGGVWEKILQNPFWHNSLLLQLGYDPRNVTNAEETVGFKQTLFAATLLVLDDACLSLERQVNRVEDYMLHKRNMAARLIGCCVHAKAAMKRMPARAQAIMCVRDVQVALICRRNKLKKNENTAFLSEIEHVLAQRVEPEQHTFTFVESGAIGLTMGLFKNPYGSRPSTIMVITGVDKAAQAWSTHDLFKSKRQLNLVLMNIDGDDVLGCEGVERFEEIVSRIQNAKRPLALTMMLVQQLPSVLGDRAREEEASTATEPEAPAREDPDGTQGMQFIRAITPPALI